MFSRLQASVHGDRRRPLEGAYETHVGAYRTQASSMPLCQRLNVMLTKWHGLIQTARNPYRPELHYMRGPGPSGTRSIKPAPKTARFDARLRNSSWAKEEQRCLCRSGRRGVPVRHDVR